MNTKGIALLHEMRDAARTPLMSKVDKCISEIKDGKLREVKLFNEKLGEKGAKVLADALKGNKSVTLLNLGCEFVSVCFVCKNHLCVGGFDTVFTYSCVMLWCCEQTQSVPPLQQTVWVPMA
jgi:hypothetical protein